ncbi:MAG: CBS domain-containing protein [Phaeobacter italicus]|jgi:CBS domain-containing protein|uniref:Hypoxic response protein 1 n=1 Tax=Phaeobacter italicus TaxID=481446 RepID=A0A0H5CXM0_9RHOB|nr:CBS domain-containing protein [Phaeobacter italicus]MEE2817240.1 CBS domain-containing protein [Pseudomonadota bacterium]MBO9441050.1 CBS domain-containing protein [Phaeobacter italicus]MBY5975799.1 CBS domain-containing protein [Phaeobacter italicus]MBY6042497.1 CBS domain-containing protein [Phaeobacter italicus]MCA0855985.1 CBS domain-containing protein [Phaeobacter italicus]|mmetsp:Transcript_8696/g.10416  ORF Transcript_8696/g.10416 Transcript_8696/m.10416 type:complete len:145 (-) Transcript_8696:79-513(-)
MLIQFILKSKASSGVVTIAPNATISEAAKLLGEHKIGTVVVSSDGETAEGILSERDIVRELARTGPSCLSDCAKDYMTRKLVTCTSQSNVEEVLQQMTEGRFRHMPVVEEGKLIGLVSLGDVVKAQLAEVAMEKDALEGMIMGH